MLVEQLSMILPTIPTVLLFELQYIQLLEANDNWTIVLVRIYLITGTSGHVGSNDLRGLQFRRGGEGNGSGPGEFKHPKHLT